MDKIRSFKDYMSEEIDKLPMPVSIFVFLSIGVTVIAILMFFLITVVAILEHLGLPSRHLPIYLLSLFPITAVIYTVVKFIKWLKIEQQKKGENK